MSEPIASFLPFVLPKVTMCPEPLALQAIKLSAIEFCRRTNIVRRVQSHSIVADTQDYTPTAVTDMLVCKVLDAWVEGRKLEFADQVDDPTALTGAAIGSATLATGSPTHFFFKTPVQLTTGVAKVSLYPVPDTAVTSGLTLRLAMQPDVACATVEDVLFDEFNEAIAHGALARIMVVPNQPYTSANAGNHRTMFLAACHEAKWQAQVGHGQGSLRVQPRRF